MNNLLLEVLTDESLRDPAALKQYLAEHASVGTPWLIEE